MGRGFTIYLPYSNQGGDGPGVNFEFPKGWYLTLYPDTEIRINLGNGDKGRLFLPLDFLVGNLITRRITASLETSVPIINDYQVYNLKIQARISFFFTPLIK